MTYYQVDILKSHYSLGGTGTIGGVDVEAPNSKVAKSKALKIAMDNGGNNNHYKVTSVKEIGTSETSKSSSSGGGGLGVLILIGLVVGGFNMFNNKDNTPTSTSTPSNYTQVQQQPTQTYQDPCAIWAQANPTLAAKLQQGDMCFGY